MRVSQGLPQELLASADFAFSGKERQNVPLLGFVGFSYIVCYQLGDVFRRGFFCGVPDFYRLHAALALDDRGLQGCSQRLGINGGRHDNDFEIFP